MVSDAVSRGTPRVTRSDNTISGTVNDVLPSRTDARCASSVLGSKVKLGADASAAAGPKGRNAGAATDIVMRAEILTYSRARGLFAGVSLEGSTLRSDGDANQRLYGRKIEAREIVASAAPLPSDAKPLIDLLNKRSPRNLSDRPK